MRNLSKLTFAVFSLLLAVFISSCTDRDAQMKAGKFNKEKSELKKELNNSIDRIDDKLDEINSKMEETSKEIGEDTKEELENTRDELQEAKRNLDENLTELNNVTEENWKEFKLSVNSAIEDLQKTLESWSDELKS